jgi:uncharacterized RDD family membrane protein YckC
MTEPTPPGPEGAPDASRDPHAPGPPPFPGRVPPPDPPAVPPPPMPPPPAGPGSTPPPPAPPPYGGPPYGPPPYGGPAAPDGVPYADFGLRLGGWLIDFVILTLPTLLITAPFHVVHRVHAYVRGMHAFRYHVGPVGVLIDAAIVILYGGILCGLPRGQTFGMMATRTRVVSAGTGDAVGFPRAFARAAFEYLMLVALILPWVIDMLFPLWDSRKQTLHDKVTDTVVITV